MYWLTYRFNTFMNFFMEFFRIAVLYFLWSAVYENSVNKIIGGYSFHEMTAYVFISVFIFSYTSGDTIFSVSSKIKDGKIVQELIKPVDFQFRFFISDLASKSIISLLNLLSFLVILYFFNIPCPENISLWIIFLVSVFLAGCIHFFIEFIISLLSFYVTNLWGIVITSEAIFEFFSGALIPLSFFPPFLMDICKILPFQYVIYVPVNIFLGKIPLNNCYEILFIQFFWTLILLIAGRILYNHALKKIVIHGG